MQDPKSNNLTWHPGHIDPADRQQRLGQRGVTVWLTGLSGSGKSTLACALEKRLVERGVAAYRLDGDNVRHGLNSDLGFGPDDRSENIRRVTEVARLFADACVVTLVSFISPYRADRDLAREAHAQAGLGFVEVFVDCPLAVAEARDPKGLYRKARAGEIKGFTGIDAPYEAPEHPEVHARTDEHTVEALADRVLGYLGDQGFIQK